MIDVQRWTWKLDIPKMTCVNEENEVVVEIKKDGKEIRGKIQEMSKDLFWIIAGHKNGPKIVQQIAFAAENAYCKESLIKYKV